MSGVLTIEEPANGVMLLTLDRPAQRNAIDLSMVDAMQEAFESFRGDARWRVAILTGRSPAFCAGLDLKSFAAPDAPRARVTALIQSVPRLGKPIIAAVNGAAYTGGLELALGCDFILAAASARFADTHAKIGALSGSGMGARLPQAVGARFAKQMMFACHPIDAATAFHCGLANELVADAELLPRAIAIATAIAANDPDLIATVKNVVDQGSETTLREALAIESLALADRKAKGTMTWSSRPAS